MLRHEVAGAVRRLRNSPATTAIAIFTLALGIGANTAIFSLLNAVVLRTLPVPHPEQLVSLATTIADYPNQDEPFSLAMFKELSRRQQIFSELFAWNGGGINTFEVTGRYVTAALAEVSGTYYRAMQIRPLLGRFIGPADVTSGSGYSNNVAVISYRAWRNWFHGDANILGQTIRVGDHHPFSIVGVEPESFSGLIIDGSTDVTIPILSTPQVGRTDLRDPRILWLRLDGRLKPEIDLEQARANMSLLWPRILEATPPPGYSGEKRARFFARKIKVQSAAHGTSFLREQFSYSLKVLQALVGAVLLIACLNLANLTLARAAAQSHEAGVRSALGASTWQLIQPALIENLLLSCSGALIGLGLAYWGSRVLLRIAWSGRLQDSGLKPSLDLHVLAFTAAVTIASGILFALPPAIHAARTDPISALRQQNRAVRGGTHATGRFLLVLQMALSLTLLSGAFLFARTLNALRTVDVGYRRDHLLTSLLFPQPGSRGKPESIAYDQQLLDEIRNIVGVDGASFSFDAPASEVENFEQVYPALNAEPVPAITGFVSPGFFATMRMRFLAGRDFTWREDPDRNPRVAIISQSLAEKLFGNANAVGRTIYWGPHAHAMPLQIVGVVNSASFWKAESIHPLALYRDIVSYPFGSPWLNVRTQVDPHSIRAEVERRVRALGRHYPLLTMTAEERLNSRLSVQRLTTLLTGFFGALALLISAIGLYGLMAFHIARRTSELRIRLALGARREQLLSMVMKEAVLIAAVGCVLGLITSLFASRVIASILFGVSAKDPAILSYAVLIFLLIALAAGFVPARRAAAVDPAVALRVE